MSGGIAAGWPLGTLAQQPPNPVIDSSILPGLKHMQV
jgi:hypothetical protein